MKYIPPFRFIRKHFLKNLLLITFISVIYVVYLVLFIPTMNWKPFLPKVVVHFDLKGAPPNIRYLRSILRGIRELGANAILLEYEDMFPFENEIKNLSIPFHYPKDELEKFLKRALELDIEVIPLIQTFGHMEYALKLEEFQHLREDPLYPASICPSKNGSSELLNNIIKQVVSLHQNITPLEHIHIGADEVFRLNICPDCTKKGLTSMALYIQHLKTVAKIITTLIPDIKILIWDDMFRRTDISYIFKKDLYMLGSEYRIQPVVWDYTAILEEIKPNHMYLYQKAFQNMWVASAYKGADGNEVFTPNLKERLLNNLNWLKFVRRNNMDFNFNGIILTGWSRYQHFQPICELLPVSYRSLTISLKIINHFKYRDVNYDFRKMYARNDWDLACKRYFDVYIEMIQACSIDIYLPSRPECSLITEDTSILHDRVVAYEDALNKYRDHFENFDFEARIMFDYIGSTTVLNFLTASHNLFKTLTDKQHLLKISMRKFFDNNVYKEYILHYNYSADIFNNWVNTIADPYSMNHENYVFKIVFARGRKLPGLNSSSSSSLSILSEL